jgi:type II secretory pathway component GspD/PulD (secretin)
MSQSSSRVLLRSKLRVQDGQAATFQVGEQYPVMTSGFFGSSGLASLAGYYPQFTFQNLGLTLKVTAAVNGDTDATLDIDAQYKVLSGDSVNGIPIVSQRALKSTACLPFGEWAVVAGLMNPQEARSLSGLAGLARIPFLGPLMSQRTNSHEDTQVLILIRPTLLAPPPTPFPAVFVGPWNRPITPL